MNASELLSIRTALLLCACICPAAHAQTPDPDQRLATLAASTSLDRPGQRPWHMVMSFELYDTSGKKAEAGTAEEWWFGPKRHKLVVSSPSQTYTLPHAVGVHFPFTRESFLVDRILGSAIHPVDLPASKGSTVTLFTKSFGPQKLDCLLVSYPLTRAGDAVMVPANAYCIDPAKGLLRISLHHPSEGVRNNLGRFLGTEVALDHSLAVDDRTAISAHIEKLEALKPEQEAAILADVPVLNGRMPGSGALVVPGHLVEASISPGLDPTYARVERGAVVLALVVGKDGHVADAVPIFSPSLRLTGKAVNDAKMFVFTPYTLDGAPVEANVVFTVNYGPPERH